VAKSDTPDVPVSKGTVKKDSKKALKQLRTLGDLIYSNSEFRKLLTDANVLFRDMFADAASKAADVASDAAHQAAQTAEDQRPSQEELNNIDNAANGGQDKDKEPPSTDEVKDKANKAGQEAKKKGKDAKKTAQKKGKQTRDDVQEYLKQKFPKQRQDAVVNRLKQVLTLFALLMVVGHGYSKGS
jgi:cobalamin biosynthesis Mg chelatase CobN